MKYTLTKTETNSKSAKFHYKVIDETGKLICGRKSSRNYVAVLINKNGGYYAWFGRLDLIGKGDSRHWINKPDVVIVKL